MDAFELKLPPPVMLLLIALLMALAWFAWPGLRLAMPARVPVAIVLAVIGVGTAMAGARTFKRIGTTLDPRRPDSASILVTGGIYRFTRNPMYLGLLLVLTGWSVWLYHALAFVGLPLFVLLMNRLQIGPEERVLTQRFGHAYATYRGRVRRWL